MGLSETLESLHSREGYEFDDRLLLSILLALAAGERNLVLRVGGEGERVSAVDRREWVDRLAQEVAWICSSIFALASHRVECDAKTTSLNFLRAMFVPTGPTPSPSFRRSRSDSATKLLDNKTSTTAAGAPRRQKRSLSLPLGVMSPAVLDARNDDRRAKVISPSPTRRLTNTSDSILAQSSAFFAEPLSVFGGGGDNPESSAGEDLFPRRPSPDRRRSSTRRISIVGRPKGDSSAAGGTAPGPSKTPPLGGGMVREGSTSTVSTHFGTTSGRTSTNTSRLPTPRTLPTLANLPDRRTTFAIDAAAAAAQSASRPPRSVSPSITSVPRIIRSPTNPTFSPTPEPFNPNSSPSLLRTQSPVVPRPSSPRPTPPLGPSLSYKNRSHSGGDVHSLNNSHRPTSAASASSSSTPRLLPQVLILERLERARPSVQQALLDVLRERRVVIHPSKKALAAAAAMTTDDAASMRTRRTADWGARDESERGWDGSFNLPKGFFVVAIVCDDPQAQADSEGSWGGVSRHLFDHFSLSQSLPSHTFYGTSSPPYSAPPAPFVHPLSPSPTPLLSASPLSSSKLSSIFLSDAVTTYAADLLSTLRHHPLLDSRMLTSRCSNELSLFIRVWVQLSRSGTEEERKKKIVTPRDVLAVVMGVVAHRVVMRHPKHEKSLFWGSDLGVLERNEQRRKGVEGVVRRVMGEV